MNSASKHSKRNPGLYTKQLHVLLHNIQTQVWYLSDHHTYGMVNKAHAEFNGKKIEDIAFSKIPKEILLPWHKIFDDAFYSNGPMHSKQQVQNSSGEYRLLSITKSPSLREDGSIEFVVCSAEDITEQNKMQEDLRQNEHNFKATLENIYLGVVVHASDSSILLCNPAATKIIGLTLEQLKGKQAIDPVWQFIYEDLSPVPVADYPVNRVILSKEPLTDYLVGVRRPDRDYITWVIVNALPIFTKTGVLDKVIVNFADITERKHAEELVKKNQKLLSSIAENYPHSYVTIIEKDLSISFASGQEFKNQNLDPDQFIGLTLDQIFGDQAEYVKNHYKKSFAGEETTFELFFNDLHLLYRTVPLIEENNSIERILVVTENITEKKLAEKIYKKNQYLLRNIFENSINLYYSHSPDHTLTYLSPQVKEMLGYTMEEAKVKWTELVSDNSINETGFKNTVRAIETGKRQPPYELELIRKDGKKIWIEVREFPEVQNGKTIAILGSLTEITEHKKAEIALQESEEKYRGVIENMIDGFYKTDVNGNVILISPSVTNILGFSEEEIIKKPVASFYVNADERNFFLDTIKKTGKVENYPAEFKKKNKPHIFIETNAQVVYKNGKYDGIEGIFRDVTERKQTEMALQENEERFRILYENSPDMYVSVSAVDGSILRCNKTLLNKTGYLHDEVVGSSVFDMYHADSLSGANEAFEQYISTGRVVDKELTLKRKNGSKLPVSLNVSAVRDESGKILHSISSWRDISERKQAEISLKESETKFRTIFENKGTATCILGQDGIVQDCNAVFSELTEYSQKEIMGTMRWSDFIATEDLNKLHKYHSNRAQKDGSVPVQYESKLITQSNKSLNVLINIAVVKETRIVSIIDITQRKRANREIQRMQRLEELGTIAGGIAHDFNNLLTGIFANLEMAKMDLPEKSSSSQYLQEAHHSILSARRLTGQLLTFAKGGAPVLKSVEMARLIQNTVDFNLHGSNVKSLVKLQDNLWSIMADEGQIEQVLANLTINSKQAMPGGGTLHVEGRNLSITDTFTEFDIDSDSIILTIKDEGIGISTKIIDHIFDPYFSTKETGHGLGLAIVYSIIKQHKGHISVTSTPNTDTTFTIILPAIREVRKEEVQKEYKEQCKTDINSSFHILIMDDEEIVRDVGTQLLERLGHTTDTANHGDEAVKKYTEAQNTEKPFDLVIMDLTIRGGKGGRETIKELLSIHPNAKVIVSSGYSSNPIMANFSSYGFAGKLAKPFEVSDLQDVILSVMIS